MTALILAALLVPDATPEATVRALVDAFNAHDLAGIARRVMGGKLFGVGYAQEWPKWDLIVGTTKIEGEEATVEADSALPNPSQDPRIHETVHLRRIEGDWQIVPAPSFGNMKTAQPIAIFATMAAHPELTLPAKRAALKTVDLSQVKQIAISLLMYSIDHKDRLPLAKDFKAAIMPYLRNAEALTAPGAPKGTVSYFLDPRLSGMRTTDIASPSETAMILEGTPHKTAYPWSGKTPVGYADGHAKMVDASLVLKARTISLR